MINAYVAPTYFDPFTWNNYIPNNNFWEKIDNLDNADVVIYIDACKKINTDKFKILYLIESEYLLNVKYADIINYLEPNLIISFNKNLINEKIIHTPPPFKSWINSPGLYKKNKLCSFITSLKQQTPMQKYRVSVYNKYKKNIDCFGIGINPIENKLTGLKDYFFSFAIENDIIPGYFSEKILDCFMTGTVPIYAGDDYIKSIFDERGIIFYNENFNINTLTENLYFEMFPYVSKNYEIAKSLNFSFDDYFLTGIKEYANRIKS